MRRALLACLAAVLATTATPIALGVVGGTPIPVDTAPWAVSVTHGGYLCSGSILDSTHVLTAGHCVYTDTGVWVRATRISVRAGVSNYLHPRATDGEQDRRVRSVRVYPGYRWTTGDTGTNASADLAVLTLAQPLDLTGPKAVAVPLASPGLQTQPGAAFELAGFGDVGAHGDNGGQLELMHTKPLRPSASCLVGALCPLSLRSAPCPGDSGSGLVDVAGAPSLVAVAVAGDCRPGEAAVYVDLSTSAARRFIFGTSPSGRPHLPAPTHWVPRGWASHSLGALPTGRVPVRDAVTSEQVFAAAAVRASFSLPDTWDERGDSDFSVAVSPHERSSVQLSVYPGRGATRTDFFAWLRTLYAGEVGKSDRLLLLRMHEVTLQGASRALHVTFLYRGRSAASVDVFYVFHDGVGWSILQVSTGLETPADSWLFRKAAQTLHFAEPRDAHLPQPGCRAAAAAC